MRTRGQTPATSNAGVDCDLCKERKGRNRAAVHILKFRDRDELTAHLKSVFPTTPYCVEWWMIFWENARRFYGELARQKYMPLWLVYMEEHGVKVNNRAEVIMKHRGRHDDEARA